MDLPTSILDALRSSNIDSAEAVHAAEHAFLNHFPLSEDLKTDCRVVLEDNKDSQVKRYPRYDSILYKQRSIENLLGSRLVFYDIVGKTGGVATRAFEHGMLFTFLGGDRTKSPGCPSFSASHSD